MIKRRLNVDIPGSVTELESKIKKFLIKRILYRMIFRGKGLEFDGYRKYMPDDDASMIDWKASKRSDKLLVKKYIEERDLRILFVIDVSDNMVFGSTKKIKCEYAVELSTALSHLILTSGDKVGFVLFNDKIVMKVLPAGGLKQFNIMVHHLTDPLIYSGGSDISGTIKFLTDYLDKSISCVIIISDFINLEKSKTDIFKRFFYKFETIGIMIRDPRDKTLPNIKGEVVLQHPVTKKKILIDPSIIRKKYEKNAIEQENMVKELFLKNNADLLYLLTEKPFVPDLASFLRERVEKRKYIMPRARR